MHKYKKKKQFYVKQTQYVTQGKVQGRFTIFSRPNKTPKFSSHGSSWEKRALPNMS